MDPLSIAMLVYQSLADLGNLCVWQTEDRHTSNVQVTEGPYSNLGIFGEQQLKFSKPIHPNFLHLGKIWENVSYISPWMWRFFNRM